ncbi:MAG TPA: hypothetical protein VMD59_18730 [Acidimicrobiales bacterium]|nr:hypothetical protein [Acidimicrobiales bacterium]
MTAADLDDAYLEHLTDVDLGVLLGRGLPEGSSPAGWPGAVERSRGGASAPALRRLAREAGVERLLARPEVGELVLPRGEAGPSAGHGWGGAGDEANLAAVSPFLVFAVAVQASVAGIDRATYVEEWVGPGKRTPVFDAPRLREFLADGRRRLFLTELLASYTRVASGSRIVATRRGYRRQRFSELDPVRLAGLLEAVAPEERPGVLRRLGDLALFLTGVFPDHVARRGFAPIEEARLLRAGAGAGLAFGRPAPRLDEPADRRAAGASRAALPPAGSSAAAFTGDGGAVGLLDRLGRRWYEAAYQLMPRPVPAALAVIGEHPERFGEARRILNHLTDRHLFARRDRFFGRGL